MFEKSGLHAEDDENGFESCVNHSGKSLVHSFLCLSHKMKGLYTLIYSFTFEVSCTCFLYSIQHVQVH